MALPAAAIPWIQAIGGAATAGAGVYTAVKASKQPKLPTAPQPPTQDTAANAAAQQAMDLRKRRGVMANIFAGASAAGGAGGNTQLGS